MNKLVVAAGAASIILAFTSVAAFADEAKGAIQSIDSKNGAVTLDNGKTYFLPQLTQTASMTAGDIVTITFVTDPGTGKLLASAVVTTRPDPKT